MSSIYDVSFNAQATDNTPPDKRGNILLALVYSFMYALQWLHDVIFNDYRTGASYVTYSSGATYSLGNRAIYQNAVYESLVNGNTGNTPALGSMFWYQTQANYIGAEERAKYCAKHLIFEFALNKWFGGTFRQPNGSGTSISDIYITMIAPTNQSFIAGLTGPQSSAVGLNTSTGFVGNVTIINSPSNMVINVPMALMSTISGGANAIKKFADQYVPAGITYTIQTY